MDKFEQLSDLKKMHEIGILSDEEYQFQKQAVLSNDLPVNQSELNQLNAMTVSNTQANHISSNMWIVIGVVMALAAGVIIYIGVYQKGFQQTSSVAQVENKSNDVTNDSKDEQEQTVDLNETKYNDEFDGNRFNNLYLSRVETITVAVSEKLGKRHRIAGHAALQRPTQYPTSVNKYEFVLVDALKPSAGPGANAGNDYTVKLEWNKSLQGFDIANINELPTFFSSFERADSTMKSINPVDDWVENYNGSASPKLDSAIGMGFSAADIRSSKSFGDFELTSNDINLIHQKNADTVH